MTKFRFLGRAAHLKKHWRGLVTFATLALGIALVSVVSGSQGGPIAYSSASAAACSASSIVSNFNGTPIAENRVIWFNAVLKVSGAGASPATVFFTGQTIAFSANGVNYSLPVPDAAVTIDPTAIWAAGL